MRVRATCGHGARGAFNVFGAWEPYSAARYGGLDGPNLPWYSCRTSHVRMLASSQGDCQGGEWGVRVVSEPKVVCEGVQKGGALKGVEGPRGEAAPSV